MSGWACVARLGGIGDNLIVASTLRPLKRLGYKVEVITGEGAHVVFQNNPFIDKLSVKGDGDVPQAGWQEWFVARAKEYELFAHLSHSCEGRHALHTSSTSFWWRPEYRRILCGGNYLETAHDIVGVAHDFGPLFFPTAEETTRAIRTRDEQIEGRYLAWVIAGSRVDKIYPFAGLAIARIIKELDIPVVMVGVGGAQFGMAKQIMEHIGRTNSVTDKLHLALSPDDADPGGDKHWSIRRSLTQALNASLVVTPDTGCAWAVAMESMPKIVLHSHASVENITKHWVNTTSLHADPFTVPCWPCHRLHDTIATCVPNKDGVNASACMSDISVQTIIENVKRLWPRD